MHMLFTVTRCVLGRVQGLLVGIIDIFICYEAKACAFGFNGSLAYGFVAYSSYLREMAKLNNKHSKNISRYIQTQN